MIKVCHENTIFVTILCHKNYKLVLKNKIFAEQLRVVHLRLALWQIILLIRNL